MGTTSELAHLCHALNYESLNPEVVDRSKYLLLDYLGVALRGTKSESSWPVYRYISHSRAAVHRNPMARS